MDRMSDSGSDDLGSNPGGVTKKKLLFLGQLFYFRLIGVFILSHTF